MLIRIKKLSSFKTLEVRFGDFLKFSDKSETFFKVKIGKIYINKKVEILYFILAC